MRSCLTFCQVDSSFPMKILSFAHTPKIHYHIDTLNSNRKMPSSISILSLLIASATLAAALVPPIVHIGPTCNSSICSSGYQCADVTTATIPIMAASVCIPSSDHGCNCPNALSGSTATSALNTNAATVCPALAGQQIASLAGNACTTDMTTGNVCRSVYVPCPKKCTPDDCGIVAPNADRACPPLTHREAKCEWTWQRNSCAWHYDDRCTLKGGAHKQLLHKRNNVDQFVEPAIATPTSFSDLTDIEVSTSLPTDPADVSIPSIPQSSDVGHWVADVFRGLGIHVPDWPESGSDGNGFGVGPVDMPDSSDVPAATTTTNGGNDTATPTPDGESNSSSGSSDDDESQNDGTPSATPDSTETSTPTPANEDGQQGPDTPEVVVTVPLSSSTTATEDEVATQASFSMTTTATGLFPAPTATDVNQCMVAPCNFSYCVSPTDIYPQVCRDPETTEEICFAALAVCGPKPTTGECSFSVPMQQYKSCIGIVKK
ncbi:hypothetical protein BC828DRAFT_393481 [Blastocladiella britannica]|nr:hypothetical protein BC828DRAFT_393481 [Blastocladiella britannica]